MQKYLLKNKYVIPYFISIPFFKIKIGKLFFSRSFSSLNICLNCRKNKILEQFHLPESKDFKCIECGKNAISILDMNAFQLFGLNYSFLINKNFLDSKYRELIKLLHPDINECTHKDIINHIVKSYKFLNNPFERALLLISIIKNTTRENVLNLMDSLQTETKFLEKIFEIDMKINQAPVNSEEHQSELKNLLKKNELNTIKCIYLLEKEFQKKNPKIERIMFVLKELRIYQKLNEKLSDIL